MHCDALDAELVRSAKNPQLAPLEKKQRDKQRKRDQAKRRKAMEKELVEQSRRYQVQLNSAKSWHVEMNHEEELQIKRYELDRINPFEEHPASAGYIFHPDRFNSLETDSSIFSPIFYRYSYAKDSQLDAPKAAARLGRDAPHPTCFGYAMSRHDPSIISPVFLGMVFHKRAVTLLDDDAMPNFAAGEAKKSPLTRLREQEELKRIMDARFDPTLECLVCESSQLPGCPGCWVPSSTFFTRVQAANAPEMKQVMQDKALMSSMLFGNVGKGGDDGQSIRELEFLQGPLYDIYAIRLHREKVQQFVRVVIKSVPAGSVVTLRVDPKSSVKYLYDLYRCHFDGFYRKMYLLLPTSHGMFWMDDTVLATTERVLAVTNGEIALEDFRIMPSWNAPTDEVIMLLSVATMHAEKTPAMLTNYIKHNFVYHGELHGIRRDAHGVPSQIVEDPLQQSMRKKADVLVESAWDNWRMSREYDQLAMRQAMKRAYDDKMHRLAEQRPEGRPRSKREIRAYAYYTFATSEPRPLLRLAKLWQCFQKFEELKLTKKGKLLDAAFSDDTAALMSLHRTATVETFDAIIDKSQQGAVQPVMAVRDKFGILLGTRMGVTAKEDREYAIELEIVLPDDVHVVEAPKKTRFHGVSSSAILAAKTWKDMEWRKDATAHKLYNGGDLLVPPYYLVRWDCFVQAYVMARSHIEKAKDQLDAYNRLAKPVQTEALLKPKEIDEWNTALEALITELPPTGALTQACRRLQGKASLLPARAARHLKALKKAQEDAAKALQENDQVVMSGADRLKHEFKLREGIWSNNFRQLTPDMDLVKERLAQSLRHGTAKTKAIAQRVHDNIEVLKL
ncbi:hypothetical protein LEN26_016517 [Aphanomyces euteiches]|nr:hypothetical protein LEN26_016517 [Aphanomyces euteiches]KAH9116327.1 hypothetical protein AeMF1_009752 [Aphanomyces euteiches]KAH9196582.1 hypothetical protein AeNC1_001442 [Aphanomyces euteiches]